MYENNAACVYFTPLENSDNWLLVLPVSKFNPSSPIHALVLSGEVGATLPQTQITPIGIIPKSINDLYYNKIMEDGFKLCEFGPTKQLFCKDFLESSTKLKIQDMPLSYSYRNPKTNLPIHAENQKEMKYVLEHLIPDARIRKCFTNVVTKFADNLRTLSQEKQAKKETGQGAYDLFLMPGMVNSLNKELQEVQSIPVTTLAKTNYSDTELQGILERAPLNPALGC